MEISVLSKTELQRSLRILIFLYKGIFEERSVIIRRRITQVPIFYSVSTNLRFCN